MGHDTGLVRGEYVARADHNNQQGVCPAKKSWVMIMIAAHKKWN